MNSISKLTLLLIVSASIGACGGNKKAVPSGNDITRPPVVEKDISASETNTDGETVSFDEWRKRREAEKKKQEEK